MRIGTVAIILALVWFAFFGLNGFPTIMKNDKSSVETKQVSDWDNGYMESDNESF